MKEYLAICPDCMGGGWAGHPDSGDRCAKCDGSGGVAAKEGYFWASHIEGTPFNGAIEPIENWWMPVEIFEGDEETLVVAILGIVDAQPIGSFIWGDEILGPVNE